MAIVEKLNLLDEIMSPELHIEKIDREQARPFIEKIHYSRLLPNNTVYCFGLYLNRELIGVCSYGIPASHHLCIGLAGEENVNNILELNRLAIKDGFGGHNYANYLVGHSLKMLPNKTFVVSYADTGWTHIGYVYQATNFLYTGLSAKRLDRFSNGKHPRCYDKNNAPEEYQTRNQKHRYVYLVGDKRTKKQMLKELKYPIVTPYPKGDERHYDTNNPVIAHPIQIIKKEKH